MCSAAAYYPEGDTIIDSIKYTKIYADGISYSYPDTYYHAYVGALREDTIGKKVYCWFWAQPNEYLLFDFNGEIGDTVNTFEISNLVISSIDSALIGTEYHRRINFYSTYGFPLYLVEGVGVNGGLFGSIYNSFGFESFQVLKCFKVNGEILLEDSSYSFTSCNLDIVTNVTLSEKNEISIAPLPASLNEYLNFNSKGDEEFKISVFDIEGRKIVEKIVLGNSGLYLDDKVLYSGLFILYIKDQHGHCFKKKLVIQ